HTSTPVACIHSSLRVTSCVHHRLAPAFCFSTAPAPTELPTLSLHDALPISRRAEVRVRIGIHTGRSKLTETGYVGIAVHTAGVEDRKSTRLNSSHGSISYAVFCLKKKKKKRSKTQSMTRNESKRSRAHDKRH